MEQQCLGSLAHGTEDYFLAHQLTSCLQEGHEGNLHTELHTEK